METKEGITFRQLCAEHGIAVTHQRQVLYEEFAGTQCGSEVTEQRFVRVLPRGQ